MRRRPSHGQTALRAALGVAAALLACEGEGGDGDGPGGGGSAGSAGASALAGAGAGAGGNAGVGGATGGGSAGTGGGGAAAGGAGSVAAGRGGAQASGGEGGAAGADAGTVAGADAASAGSGGGSAGCAGTGYLICEDFEAAALGGTPDGWTKHGDESAVTDDQAHGGAHALELGPIAVWERRIYHDASALGSAHWGRIHFKVQQPVPDAFVHSTLVAFSGVGPTRGASEYRVVDTVKQAVDTPNVGSRIQFLWNVQPQSSGEFGEGTSYDREFDELWHCAEWHVDAADQSYQFFLDGEELISFANGAGNYDGTDIPDAFQEIKIGWINYQDAPPGFTAWLDDLAVDDTRVGCL